jgi:hypothetical protein
MRALQMRALQVPTLQSTEIKGCGRSKAIVNDILARQIVRPHGNNCDLSLGPNFARRGGTAQSQDGLDRLLSQETQLPA